MINGVDLTREMKIEDAKKKHARDLACLAILVGEGIPEFLWQGMIEGDESSLDVGTRRVAREEGGFSYRNARICLENDEVLGMILSYRQPEPYEVGDLSEYHDVVHPLIKLEAQAPGSWYVNAVATYEKHRGKGVASKLIADAEARARAVGCELMSLIVGSENDNARAFYQHLGFNDVASFPVVSPQGRTHGGDWVLMTKRINTK